MDLLELINDAKRLPGTVLFFVGPAKRGEVAPIPQNAESIPGPRDRSYKDNPERIEVFGPHTNHRRIGIGGANLTECLKGACELVSKYEKACQDKIDADDKDKADARAKRVADKKARFDAQKAKREDVQKARKKETKNKPVKSNSFPGEESKPLPKPKK